VAAQVVASVHACSRVEATPRRVTVQHPSLTCQRITRVLSYLACAAGLVFSGLVAPGPRMSLVLVGFVS
jgi:hypothetical protein